MRVGPLTATRRGVLLGAVASLLLSGCFASSPQQQPSSPVVVTPVPPPSGGSVSETVAPSVEPAPVVTDLKGSATPMAGLEVHVAEIEAVDAKAQAPGEVSGPAVAVTLEVKNSSDQPFDPSGLQITVTNEQGDPGSGLTGPPANWMTDSIPAGGEASGVYVFSLPKENRNPITVSVVMAPGLPRVDFAGEI